MSIWSFTVCNVFFLLLRVFVKGPGSAIKGHTMTENGRRGDEDDRSPGAAHQVFCVMDSLLDKLKALKYEDVLVKHNMKNLSR